ncbi:TIGR03862 family flavoprotein [Luteimonas yindakuii]|uniref:TIGR03862 family flavoprotein n=1 Tax=Luteimonas yindakuii TaxID=2565782 RepID=A0A4Z1RJQ7_9GAMM|nr:TIGR03862 family flavoprotein [Luteimonas yindakuii]TKS53871.1 TIGR03862 family flavoprotein [Luteimonas yindakuii]
MSEVHPSAVPGVAIVGGGPAGLIAAEILRAAGMDVDLFEAKGSVGRKFLIAGKGGLNLTHSEPFDAFVARYGARSAAVAGWLRRFDAQALRDWARGHGVETFVGSSGRVFPADLKAAPLLRGWVRRLREAGVRFHVQHRWLGWDDEGAMRFDTPHGARSLHARATLLALGGASWPQLGSDGAWVPALQQAGIEVAPLQPANCGFDIDWSAHFAERHAGAPLKPVVLQWNDMQGSPHQLQGECVVTAAGIEGSAIYAIAAGLRDAIARDGETTLWLDLVPGRDIERLTSDLGRPRGKRSVGEHLRRSAGIAGAQAGLLREVSGRELPDDPRALATLLKRLPLRLQRPRPVAEAISTAGGVRLETLDDALMAPARPGVFVAGEMLDWEAPTGGYLLTACFASGVVAAEGVLAWLARGETATAAIGPDAVVR